MGMQRLEGLLLAMELGHRLNVPLPTTAVLASMAGVPK
jgi:hypothetical protein